MLSTVTPSSSFRSLSPSITTFSGHRHPPSPSTVRFRSKAVAQSAPSICPYDVLGIPIGASGEAIKAAYRSLARTCHPDVAADSPAEDFVRINDAYSTLSDPDKRADYDRVISRRFRNYEGGLVSVSPLSGFSGYTSRNWETDQCW